MPDYEGAYAGTSGLRDDFNGTIKSGQFVYDSEYDNGNTLIARLEVEDDEGGEPIILKLSTGKGWEDDEKGKLAKLENGKDPVGFNKSCNYYLFSKSAADTDYGKHMFKTAPPWDMTVWEGEPRFHFTTMELPPVEKGGKPRTPTIVDEFLGFGEGGAKSKAKSTTKATDDEPKETPAQKAKRIAAEKKAKAAATDDEESADLTLLKSIAKETDSHEEFMERAYGELEDADALEEQIVDEDFYTSNH